MATLQQVEFETDCSRRVAWVDVKWGLKAGNLVTFDEQDDAPGTWKVIKVYDTKIDSANLNMKWGLGLPKSQRTER